MGRLKPTIRDPSRNMSLDISLDKVKAQFGPGVKVRVRTGGLDKTTTIVSGPFVGPNAIRYKLLGVTGLIDLGDLTKG